MIHRSRVNEWTKARKWMDLSLFFKCLMWLLLLIYMFFLLKIEFGHGHDLEISRSVNWVPMNRINTLFYLSDHRD
ncbi:hypothetical protein NIE88_13920 [Sporolactobacillus shoreicorticis]|uniref:Uncharacterized protein n=1 Tax=Sporolactobacillus shoreicorticis TaxID=1923877 RepID=A0ABW5S787_9BACL|nr:hypothetical protein [Sporolactobacillus shoreicorticis]MCO7126865.1 hypothetical protein [Sporolactobacillus shoreicorticis]